MPRLRLSFVSALLAIRGDVDRKYPWLAFNLYKPFVRAKKFTKTASAKACRRECFSAANISPNPRMILGDRSFPLCL